MEANARNLERIFDSTISYQIPLFQRPYVWTKEQNWVHLWDDIIDVANRYLDKQSHRNHFLGAVVLERSSTATGSIETRQVIDGQQRFTTLQILMIAIRDLCGRYNNTKLYDRFNDLVCNKRSKVDLDHEAYKIWPTNSDRKAFETVHRYSKNNSDELDEDVKSSQIFKAYLYFYEVLEDWLNEKKDIEDSLDALWQVVRDHLQIVVIDLSSQDEAQVIFETLNARGTQLLPADLIKNFLFRKAEGSEQEVERLYIKYWAEFDSGFWREEVKQGRTKRPRIDWFLQNYLSLMLQDDIKVSHLFDSFKKYVNDTEDSYSKFNNAFFQHPETISEHLIALKKFSKLYQSIVEPKNERMTLFLYRLEAVDTATVYPLLLLAMLIWKDEVNSLNKFLSVLESYLVRRMVCRLTSKNYNRFFMDVIKEIYRTTGNIETTVTVDTVHKILSKSDSDTSRMPDDKEVRQNLVEVPLYSHLAQYKIRMVLEALDDASHHNKTESVTLPKNLTIEHLLPNKWEKNWPLDIEGKSAEEVVEEERRRNILKNTLGNLTLITGSLNPALSNESWEHKRPEILKYSKLNLNRYFQAEENETLNIWNEEKIIERSNKFTDLFISIWQPPLSYS